MFPILALLHEAWRARLECRTTRQGCCSWSVFVYLLTGLSTSESVERVAKLPRRSHWRPRRHARALADQQALRPAGI
jgi:hypothetical protein